MTPPRTVIVTGAASGIGRAVAERLGTDGFQVVCVDRTEPALAESVAEWVAAGLLATAVSGDVRERETHRRAVAAATSSGPLHAWIGCAGITRLHDLTDLSEPGVREVIDINQLGLLWGAAEAVTHWRAAGRPGVVVAVSSVHARYAAERHPVYEMTKAAAEALVRSIAVTEGRRGIRAVAVAPGAIDTPALRASLHSAADPAAARQRLELFSPLERIGGAAEIASAVAFLISDDAAFISGSTLTVDGGWSAVLARDSADRAARRSS